MDNFAESQHFPYFRRNIIVWTDLIKLRYGKSKKDCPALWKYMKQYVQIMAKTFHGFRIDNAHSTPISVGEYFLRKARIANPQLIIFGELFTGDAVKDALFVKRWGLNAIVKELIYN